MVTTVLWVDSTMLPPVVDMVGGFMLIGGFADLPKSSGRCCVIAHVTLESVDEDDLVCPARVRCDVNLPSGDVRDPSS